MSLSLSFERFGVPHAAPTQQAYDVVINISSLARRADLGLSLSRALEVASQALGGDELRKSIL